MIAMVYAEWTEESTGEIHGLAGASGEQFSWHGDGTPSDARERLEANSHQVILAIARSSALGGIPE
jgi:hypothetical protein